MPAVLRHELPVIGEDPPPSVWLPPAGTPAPEDAAPGVAWWVVARLASQLSRPGQAVVHVDGSGQSTRLSEAARSDVHAGLVIVEVADAAGSAEGLVAAYRLLSPSGTLAVVLPPDTATDLAGETVAAARAAGLVYLQHIVAVETAVSCDVIDAAAEAGPVEPAAHARVHHDVLIFTQPAPALGAQR